MSKRPLIFIAGFVCALGAGCVRCAEAPAPLEVQVSGCRSLEPGPTCELAVAQGIRFWLPHTQGKAFTVHGKDGAPLPFESVEVEGGTRLSGVPPEGTPQLELRAEDSRRRFTVRLHSRPPSAIETEVKSLRAAGEPAKARALLESALPALEPEARAWALGALGRAALAQGDVEVAARHLESASHLQEALGRHSLAVDEAMTAAFALVHYAHRFAAGRALLERARMLLQDYPDGRARLPYYQHLISAHTGDWRTSIPLLDQAIVQGTRLGIEPLVRNARQRRAAALLRMGRFDDARQELSRVEAELEGKTGVACERADLHATLGWLKLRGEGAAAQAASHFEQALELESRSCVDAHRRSNLQLNLALAALELEEPERAATHLAAAREALSTVDLGLELWMLEAQAALALQRGDAHTARAHYEALSELAERTASPEARWRAARGRATAHLSLGQPEQAERAFAQAEALLEDERLWIPVTQGQGDFLRTREAGTKAYVELLLTMGRAPDALTVVRRARTRVLRGLSLSEQLERLDGERRHQFEELLGEYRREREALEKELGERWMQATQNAAQLTAALHEREGKLLSLLDRAWVELAGARKEDTPLAAPGKGELLLAYFPLPQGWVGLAELDGEVVARTVEALSAEETPASLSRKLLTPFTPELGRARLLRVLPYGPLRNVDFHALPYRDSVLLEALPVAYALDVGGAPSDDVRAPPENARSRSSLVVGNPTLDLPASEKEAQRVQRALQDRGPVQLLVGAGATRAAILKSLEGAGHLHYAGHGRFAGRAGWESALPLHGDEKLTAGDVLALRSAPRSVVLSACEAGRSSKSGPVEEMGLAQAFILAGSHSAIAPSRPVEDELAHALVQALYGDEEHEGEVAKSAPAALQRAQLRVRRTLEGADWAAFRIWVP